jgi:hypothetical protein
MYEVAVATLAGRARPSDFLELARRYDALWRAERKPEGLDVRVTAFWAAAGREDAKLYVNSRGRLATV